jgi:hypothetical protein
MRRTAHNLILESHAALRSETIQATSAVYVLALRV